MLSSFNSNLLKSILHDKLVLYMLSNPKLSTLQKLTHCVRGYIDGVCDESINLIRQSINLHEVSVVFLDGSNLGTLIPALKRSNPSLEVITFFHNVEARFFWGALRLHPSLHSLGVLWANALAEYKAVKHSDKIVCLSERDSRLLNKLYGRGATHIAPMVLEDKYQRKYLPSTSLFTEPFALFVGGTFYANNQGISWFVREVVPEIDLPVFIVGRGFEALRGELECPGKVKVIGTVDSLSDWYLRAQFVIAPIFDGSGMKTKVAEALMYGKKIIGTPEAFSGYEGITDQVGWVCQTRDEFVSAIQAARREIDQSFYPELRAIYEQNYSMSAARSRFMHLLS